MNSNNSKSFLAPLFNAKAVAAMVKGAPATPAPLAVVPAATVKKGPPPAPPSKVAVGKVVRTPVAAPTTGETAEARVERIAMEKLQAAEKLQAVKAAAEAERAAKAAKAAAERAAQFNPSCLASSIGAIQAGDEVFVVAQGAIRRATVGTPAKGWIIRLKADGMEEHIELHVSYVFASPQDARAAIKGADLMANTPIVVDFAKDAKGYDEASNTWHGRLVAVFAPTKDYGKRAADGSIKGSGYFLGHLTSDFAPVADGLYAVEFPSEQTWAGDIEPSSVFDTRTVTDPLTAQYALRRSIAVMAAAQLAMADSEVVVAVTATPIPVTPAAGKDMTLDTKAGKKGPLPEGKAAMEKLSAPPSLAGKIAAATGKKAGKTPAKK